VKSPGPSQRGRCDTESNGIGQRVQFPAEIAARLRNTRGDFRGSERPFLVGQISASDPLFADQHEAGKQLKELYDMVIQRPSNFENFPKNIATGIYNAAHRDAPLAFDIDFRLFS